MLASTTASEMLTASITTFKDIAGPAILSIIAVAVLLIGAGYVWVKFKKHVAGNKI